MEVSKALIVSYLRHTKTLIENGKFDCRDVRIANALRLARKEIQKIERRLRDEKTRN